MSATLKLDGFKDLEQRLDNLTKAAGKAALRRSIKKAAQPTADLASSLAPVDKGTLSKSIIVGTKLDGRQAKLHKRMFRDEKASVEMFVGPSYLLGAGGRHGHLLEFGTFKTAAQPFMRPAWEQDQAAMLARLKDQLWTEIEKSVARAQRKAAKG